MADVKVEMEDSHHLDSTMDTTQESGVSFNNTTVDNRGEASADSEEDSKLLIDVKEEPMDVSAMSRSTEVGTEACYDVYCYAVWCYLDYSN